MQLQQQQRRSSSSSSSSSGVSQPKALFRQYAPPSFLYSFDACSMGSLDWAPRLDLCDWAGAGAAWYNLKHQRDYLHLHQHAPDQLPAM
jgi:hypothetical protein